MSKAKCKPVRCVETGEVFPSAKEAALRLGLSKTAVSGVVLGNVKTAGGYHWEYVYEKDKPVRLYEPKETTRLDKQRVDKPRSRPNMSIYEVQAEARRRTEETGRLVQYSDIQKEETLRLIKEGKL